MGAFIELNDTLQLTREQGFPAELDLEKHKAAPYKAEDFKGKVFEFKDKKNPRIFLLPPVRIFLVENIADKWLHWGMAHIIEETIDSTTNTTRGKFEIVQIYTYEEMQQAAKILYRGVEEMYLKENL